MKLTHVTKKQAPRVTRLVNIVRGQVFCTTNWNANGAYYLKVGVLDMHGDTGSILNLADNTISWWDEDKEIIGYRPVEAEVLLSEVGENS